MLTQPKFGSFSDVFADCVRSSKWRKASKCKQYIQILLCSIKVHRRRREAMVRQSRSDIAQLLPYGRFSEEIPKARHIYEDERRLSAYDQVENLCKSILQNFSPLMRQSDVNLLSEETKEAMAGLIFAAARIGELKELQHIRNLFVERFGFEFDKDSVDLRPGNIVGLEMIKILDTKMSQQVLSKEFVTGIISQIDQTNADSDTVKIEKPKTAFWRKKVMMKNSKFLHPNLGESQGRDRS